jgi:hypothetical protein
MDRKNKEKRRRKVKKNVFFAVLFIVALIFAGSATIVKADTIDIKVHVEVDNTYKARFTGPDGGRVDTVVQFCDWEHRKKCSKNIIINRSNDGTFQLDPGGLAHHQTDFNGRVGKLWILFSAGDPEPNDAVTVGNNVTITDSPEGARFHYTGSAPR